MHLSSLLNGSEPPRENEPSLEKLRRNRPEDSLPSPEDFPAGTRETEAIPRSSRFNVGGTWAGGVYSLPLPIQTKHAAMELSKNRTIKSPDAGEVWENSSLPSFGRWSHSPGRAIPADVSAGSAEMTLFGADEGYVELRKESHNSRHKLSDSQSSVVSYSSSYGAHSRASSVTTVSDSGSMTASVTETLPPITKLDPVREETPSPDNNDAHHNGNLVSKFTFQVEGVPMVSRFACESSKVEGSSNLAALPRASAEPLARVATASRFVVICICFFHIDAIYGCSLSSVLLCLTYCPCRPQCVPPCGLILAIERSVCLRPQCDTVISHFCCLSEASACGRDSPSI
jgi:hypothetical protein